ncbi:MAG: bifunctional phosphoglucose/phosphomannose isomerase [Balneolales bacterium]
MIELTEKKIKEIDSEGMYKLMHNFPQQWNDAEALTLDLKLSKHTKSFANICILGMGASAIGGDLIASYAHDNCPLPIQVNRNYDLPAWVNESTLVIVSSYSGDTEETLQAFDIARYRKAGIICISTGGEIMRQAERAGSDRIYVPAGITPRAALAFNFIPLFRIFQYYGFIQDTNDVLHQTAAFLSDQAELLSNYKDNETLGLAEKIDDTLPIVYSNSTFLAPVNLRWRGQLEENAKILAYGNLFPELNHNEIVGWERIAHLMGRISVIMLHDEDDNPRVKRRMKITEELIENHVSSLITLTTRGPNRLSRLFSLIQVADWTSLYLALNNELDPTPITKVDLLKNKLSEE